MSPFKKRLGSFLREHPDLELLWDEPLSRHTTFRIGGPIWCLARPRSENALAALMDEVRQLDVPMFVFGGGSNLLPPDHGIDAVALQLQLCCGDLQRTQEDEGAVCLHAGAGIGLQELIRYCLRNGLAGLGALAGIPGTLGGALVMNAGTPAGSISDTLTYIDLAVPGEGRRRIARKEFSPAYRSMGLPEECVVLGGGFRLKMGDGEAQRVLVKEILELRKKNQPLEFPSAGSVFKNPPGGSAWELIERAGLKGFRIGDAEVSKKHSNWIINRGSATSRDVLEVIEKIEKEVFGTFGVRLEREIRILDQF